MSKTKAIRVTPDMTLEVGDTTRYYGGRDLLIDKIETQDAERITFYDTLGCKRSYSKRTSADPFYVLRPEDDEVTPVTFKKFDSNKPDMVLFPYEVIEPIIRVLEVGAKKYGRDNWRRCEDPKRYANAFIRHMAAWLGGEILDKETGLPHLHHMACNIVFLVALNVVDMSKKPE
jgi:hypothetical protein